MCLGLGKFLVRESCATGRRRICRGGLMSRCRRKNRQVEEERTCGEGWGNSGESTRTFPIQGVEHFECACHCRRQGVSAVGGHVCGKKNALKSSHPSYRRNERCLCSAPLLVGRPVATVGTADVGRSELRSLWRRRSPQGETSHSEHEKTHHIKFYPTCQDTKPPMWPEENNKNTSS